ncbi:transposase [Siminovitchia fortis]|uniref:transposase n=2 Tax=Siminovitchia fortis TaxID=254758 RepID=UPI0011AB73BE|nr:transposase [Siminovitchia fortis]
MAKKGPRYVVELFLKTEIFQVHILEKRFEIGRHIYNACKRKMLDNIQQMRKDETYQFWLKQEKSKTRTKKLIEIREAYDISKTGAERIVNHMGKHFLSKKPKNEKHKQKVHLDSHVVQKIALNVWESIEDYLFNPKTKKVRFKKFGEFNTLESKTNKSGIRYKNGFVEWNGLKIKAEMPKPGKDSYLEAALHDEIAYCRIVRKIIRGRTKFYLQLVMKGIPPQKRKPVEGKVGLDNGISTVATVSDKSVNVQEFCKGLDELDRERRILLRRMDRSRRATNPNKFNDNGTFKKGNKDKWIRSKRYWKTLYELKEICRKIAAVRKMMHNKLANEILSEGNEVYAEWMNYKGLHKTRLGKRMGIKAPAAFLEILDRKLKYQGRQLIYVNTWTVKASQYCPIGDVYAKKPLSLRFHALPCGRKIQRDIFSAWLIKNVNETLDKVDRQKCLNEFHTFYEMYQSFEEKMRSLGEKHISSIGF